MCTELNGRHNSRLLVPSREYDDKIEDHRYIHQNIVTSSVWFQSYKKNSFKRKLKKENDQME